MIFFILNIVAGIAMFMVASAFNRKTDHSKANEGLVNLTLISGVLMIISAACLGVGFWVNQNMALIVMKLFYAVMGWYSIKMCDYLMSFPAYENGRVYKVFKYVLYTAALVMPILMKGIVSAVSVTTTGIQILSDQVFTGEASAFIKIRWFDLYVLLTVVAVPLVTAIMAWTRMENNESKLDRQRMRLSLSGLILLWLLLAGIHFGYRFQPMLLSLMGIIFLPVLAVFYCGNSQTDIYDFKGVMQAIGKFMLRFGLPAAVVGAAFAFTWHFYPNHRTLYIFAVIGAVCFIAFVVTRVTKLFSVLPFMRDRHYGDAFEAELTSIDFEKDSETITGQVFQMFQNYVGTTSMQVLIDNGAGFLETIYNSQENQPKLSLPMECEAFDAILNIKHTIVFREWVNRNYAISGQRQNLNVVLDQAQSDAFVLLTEGRHIVGIILLGPKKNGNIYNAYDYSVFKKMYSNFFVLVYYMKNIMNEDVVGTVNREIRMSGQIITSIQENMDRMKNEKIDAGYLMVPAHNIGGEFIDFIRLNSTRHIFIIGALSGKGIAASMNMVILKSIIRTFLADTKDFKQLVIKVNDFIRDSLPKGTLFFGTFGLIDFGTNTMYYINCGSSGIFLYTKAYNNVIEIQGEGRVLGFSRDLEKQIKVKKVRLAPGDIVFSCTDGLLESVSLRGERFGKIRVQKNMVENMQYPAQKMAQFTFDALGKFTSTGLENDITILTLKYLGGE